MNRAPSFQFYPDKWQSHTRRLSHEAYRVYHELMCWMWQSSQDYCSIEANIEAVSVAVAMPTECVRIAMAEIQNKHAPLLKKEGRKWVSNGLKKEAEKQSFRREKAKESADARWHHANALKNHALASLEQCSSTPTLSPALSPTLEVKTKLESVRFSPPKPEEVTEYSASIGHPMNGQAWCDSYAVKGWKVGKNVMKDWKAAVRTWKNNGWNPIASMKQELRSNFHSQ